MFAIAGIRRPRLVIATLVMATIGLLGSAAAASAAPTSPTGAITASASAAAAKPLYTFTIADLGQGAWGGGALLSDGSINGGGGLSDGNGQVIATIRGLYWQQDGPGAVTMCFVFNFKKPFTGPVQQCVTLPVGGPTKVNLGGDEQTMIRVTPTGTGR